MKYTLTKRDIGILLGFLGIVILGLIYYLVYRDYTANTEELKAANTTLQSRVDILQSIADQQDQLVSETRNFEEKTEEIMEHYPAGFQDEDGFMLAVDLQAVSPLESVFSVANTDPMQLYQFEDIKAQTDQEVGAYIQIDGGVEQIEGEAPPEDTAVEEESTEEVTSENASNAFPELDCKDTTIVCTCDYPSFKNAAAYLIDKNEKHSIKIEGVYDIATGILASTFTVRSPYVVNTDKQYTEPEVPFIIQGTDNIFGTISLQDSRAVSYGTTRSLSSNNTQNTREETGE